MMCVDDQALPRPGVLVESRRKPNVASVLCVTLHGGASLTRTGAQTALVTSPLALTFFCAFYRRELLDKGVQPYQQPAAAAYMPLPWSALEAQVATGTGTLFVERAPRKEPLRRLLVDDGQRRRVRGFALEEPAELAREIATFAERAGVSGAAHARVCDRVLSAVRRAVESDDFAGLAPRPARRGASVAPTTAARRPYAAVSPLVASVGARGAGTP